MSLSSRVRPSIPLRCTQTAKHGGSLLETAELGLSSFKVSSLEGDGREADGFGPGHDFVRMAAFDMGKTFHRGTQFPSPGRRLSGRVIQQWPGELQAKQVVTIGIGYPQCPGAYGTGSFGQLGGSGQRRRGEFRPDP